MVLTIALGIIIAVIVIAFVGAVIDKIANG